MAVEPLVGLYFGAVGLGLLHGLEPGHGWPVAAAWALARPARWRAGVFAAGVIGLGHLASSIAVVLLFFAVKARFGLGEMAWIDWLAGGLLLALAAWQLHSVWHQGPHHHHRHHADHAPGSAAGLGALALFALALGFAHEEEFQIIALCAGSSHCLGLMLAYAAAVIGALIALTLALIAGLQHVQYRIEHAERGLTLLSAAILAVMAMGLIAGVF